MIGFVTAIVVDLSSQTMTVVGEDQKITRVFSVSTGKRTSPTPTGKFRVYSKYPAVDLVGEDYRIPMKNVMCFNGPNERNEEYCIHPTPPWSPTVGTPLSRGCVRMKPTDAKWLFDRTKLETPVVVQK